MNKIALSLALGAAALLLAPAANAAQARSETPTAATTDGTVQATDMSSHRRHWRRYHRHHAWGYHRPYYNSYAYYPRPYYRPAPSFSFSIGGGPRWHRHHYYGW